MFFSFLSFVFRCGCSAYLICLTEPISFEYTRELFVLQKATQRVLWNLNIRIEKVGAKC